MPTTSDQPPARQERFLSFRLRPWGLLTSAMALACVATLAGSLGGLWWYLENLGCFKVQCCLFLALSVPIYWLGKRRNSALVLAAFALANAAAFVPLYFGGDKPAGPPQLRVMMINVHTENRQYAKVVQAVRDARPDIVVLLEVNSVWVNELLPLRDEYPFCKVEPRPDNFGIAFFSKLKPAGLSLRFWGEAGVPTVVLRLPVNGATVTLIGTHPVPPVSKEYIGWRNEQLAGISRYIKTLKEPVVLVGDMNMTSDSPAFGRLCREAGLRDSRQGFGVQATWPADLLPLRIAIDHCLVSQNVLVHDRRVGSDVGSDHYPVIVDVSVRE